MEDNSNKEWAVVRLTTLQKKDNVARLLFATVTELTPGRPIPTGMSGIESFEIKSSKETVHFRRTILSKEDATTWYRSLGEMGGFTPQPTREGDRDERLDNIPILVPRLDDVQPWPSLGLPISQDLFSSTSRDSITPAPFIGSASGRIHRRFGERSDFEGFIQNSDAHDFVARRMHINLFDYQEYLGSAVYIVPDPIIRQIDHFMVPAEDGRGERIIYRIVPHCGQSLGQLSITTFDKEARLLTSFKTYRVPDDGILDIEKGTCMGEYGFVITHDVHGVLVYKPSSAFLRQMNVNLKVSNHKKTRVSVPISDSIDSQTVEYEAAVGSERLAPITHGEVKAPSHNFRVNSEARKREKRADANHYGQRWFTNGSRAEASHFIRELLRDARSRVIIADPYLGHLQLDQFLYTMHGQEMDLTLLTTKLAFSPKHNSNETKLGLLEAFDSNLKNLQKNQCLVPKVKVISISTLHDRFLVVDDDVWFLGNSLNSLGEKASMIVRVPDPDEVITKLSELSKSSPDLTSYIKKVSKNGAK